MENLSFLEISHVKEKEKDIIGRLSGQSCDNSTMSFLAQIPKKPGIRDITEEIYDNRFVYKPPYTIFFLYDFMNNDASRNFISVYGGELHKKTSMNISIVTYYTTRMVENWSNIPYRETVRGAEQRDYNNIMNKIRSLQSDFNISYLPALVVVNNNDTSYNNYCSVYLSDLNKDEIYDVMIGVINIINNNYEADFQEIKRMIKGDIEEVNEEDIYEKSTFSVTKSLAKKCGIRLDNLAQEMGIDVKTFYNKRKNRSLTRDEILYMGLKLGITVNELDFLLHDNNQQKLGYDGRDGDIRIALSRGYKNTEVEKQTKKKLNS